MLFSSAFRKNDPCEASLTPSPVARRTVDVKPRQLDELVLIVAQLELIVDEVLGTVSAVIAVLGLCKSIVKSKKSVLEGERNTNYTCLQLAY